MKKRGRFTLGQLLLSAVMVLLALTMLIPMLNILAKSFSDPALSPSMSGLRVIPAGFSTVNYDIVFSNKVILPTLWNSIFITVVGTAINILLTTSAAYVLIQPGLMFKKIIMTFLIVMMLFDPGLVPEYLLVKQLGLIGSQWSVILVTSVNVYYLIIMMRYFQAVPMDIYEAARIDGAKRFRLMWNISVPTILPVVVVMLLLQIGGMMNAGFDSFRGIFCHAEQLDRASHLFCVLDIGRRDFGNAFGVNIFKCHSGIERC